MKSSIVSLAIVLTYLLLASRAVAAEPAGKKAVRTTGALEFRVVASKHDNQTLIELAATARKEACLKDPKTDKARFYYGKDPNTGKPTEFAKWCRVRAAEPNAMRSDAAADTEAWGSWSLEFTRLARKAA